MPGRKYTFNVRILCHLNRVDYPQLGETNGYVEINSKSKVSMEAFAFRGIKFPLIRNNGNYSLRRPENLRSFGGRKKQAFSELIGKIEKELEQISSGRKQVEISLPFNAVPGREKKNPPIKRGRCPGSRRSQHYVVRSHEH